MTNPTEQECKALAEAWPEHFMFNSAHDFLILDSNDKSRVALCQSEWLVWGSSFEPDRFTSQFEGWVMVPPELGQAALTAKCREVAKADGLLLRQDPQQVLTSNEIRWRWRAYDKDTNRIFPHPFLSDTPWAALLATKRPNPQWDMGIVRDPSL